jgi:hypothetical protein
VTTGCDAGFVANTKKAVYKMKTVYKIVYKTDDKRLSSLFAPPPYSVNYHVGEWATAPVGGLLAFKTLKQAKALWFGEREKKYGSPQPRSRFPYQGGRQFHLYTGSAGSMRPLSPFSSLAGLTVPLLIAELG